MASRLTNGLKRVVNNCCPDDECSDLLIDLLESNGIRNLTQLKAADFQTILGLGWPAFDTDDVRRRFIMAWRNLTLENKTGKGKFIDLTGSSSDENETQQNETSNHNNKAQAKIDEMDEMDETQQNETANHNKSKPKFYEMDETSNDNNKAKAKIDEMDETQQNETSNDNNKAKSKIDEMDDSDNISIS